jgi:hypothetical protein
LSAALISAHCRRLFYIFSFYYIEEKYFFFQSPSWVCTNTDRVAYIQESRRVLFNCWRSLLPPPIRVFFLPGLCPL